MIKAILDWTSVGIAAGALTQALPAGAALMTIIWLGLRTWESKTVQGWVRRGKVSQGDAVDSPDE